MWVKLTDIDDNNIFVNLDRFDRMTVVSDKGMIFTRLLVVLSATEEDEFYLDVKETPEEIVEKLHE